MSQYATIVVDNGSHTIKAGFSGNDDPILVFSTVVGRPRVKLTMVGIKDFFVGEEAQSKRGMLTIKKPIEKGIICDWDDMEKIWQHTFDSLDISLNEKSVLLSDSPLNTLENREKIVEIMFEKFKVSSLYLENQATLALNSTGRESGVILDSSVDVTLAVPIHEGQVLREAILSMDYGGHNLDEYLVRLISERGYSFSLVEWLLVQDIKEKMCFVALDYDSEIKAPVEKSYELPDGNCLTLSEECFKCPEALFKPQQIAHGWYNDSDSCLHDSIQFNSTTITSNIGIHQVISNSIMKCDSHIRDSLRNNIILAGGSTMFRGLHQRLSNELVALNPETNFKVEKPLGLNTAWIGGSMIAQLSTFPSKCLAISEYQEFGSSITQRKFL